jgi:hypothetical protein
LDNTFPGERDKRELLYLVARANFYFSIDYGPYGMTKAAGKIIDI